MLDMTQIAYLKDHSAMSGLDMAASLGNLYIPLDV